MTTGQTVPPGFYISNAKNESTLYADKDGAFYFRDKVSTGQKWVKTDKWNFDHLCSVETVNATQGADLSMDDHDGRGMEVKVSAHIGVSVTDVVKWHYVNPDGNQATLWAGPDVGAGEGMSMDCGVWYDKDGDIHVKMATSGVIPHVAFGANIVLNPKTITNAENSLTKPTADDKAFSKGLVEGMTGDIVTKPPKVVTGAVAAVHKVADKVWSWIK